MKPDKEKTAEKVDITILVSKIEEFHIDPYKNISKEDLLLSLDKACDVEEKYFPIALQESLALLKDAHTKIPEVVEVWGDRIPIRLKEIDGHYYIIGTNESNSELQLQELLQINGYDISEIVKSLSKLSSQENSERLLSDMERLLRSVDVLEYYGYANDRQIILTTESGTHQIEDDTGEVKVAQPLGWKNKDIDYIGNEKYRYRVEGNTVIFQYNACNNRGHSDDELAKFKRELLESSKEASNIVVDLRLNDGGNTSIMMDLFDKLPKHLKVYVAIGRKTFSSAMHHMLFLKNERGAILIGENAGQKPNRFGDTEVLKLPNSEVEVFCSWKYFELLPGKDIDVIEPDTEIPVTISNYKENVDPVEKWIKDNLLDK